MPLTNPQRRQLKGLAHHLKPVVMVGQHGLSDGVLNEVAVALDAHELIKVRAAETDREARNALLSRICDSLGAAPVQHIGKILVIYRPAPDKPETPPKRKASAKSRRTKRAHQND